MLQASLHRLAEAELNDAARYYDAQTPGLGGRMLDEVSRALQFLVEYPDAGSQLPGGFRKYRLHRFPYTVVYAVIASNLRVFAIAHQKRLPTYWADRD